MILVTGSDGFVGTAVCREMLRRRIPVRGCLWQPASLPDGCESIVVGDIGAHTEWNNALVDVEAVVHLAARVHIMDDEAIDPISEFRKTNVEGTRHLAASAAKAGVKRFLYLSSIKVNGEFTEHRDAAIYQKALFDPNPIESAIVPAVFKETDEPRPKDPYAVSKWEAEKALWEIEARTGMPVTILRSPLIYGPGVKANFLKLVQLVDRGIPLPFGGIHNRRSFLGLTNLADLICLCLKHPAARNELYMACDGDDVATPELIRRIALALGKRPRLLPIPGWMMKLAGTLTGKSAQIGRLCSSLLIDSSKARQRLGWAPPSTMDKELRRIAEWYLSKSVKSA